MLPIVCAVEERVPRGNDHRRITSAVEKLKELDSVRQAASREMLHVLLRLLFALRNLRWQSSSVRTIFCSSEHHSVEEFVLKPSQPTPVPRARVAIASTILRQAKKQRSASRITTQYDELRTSHPREATRASVYSPLHLSTLPANFERMMFLRANRDRWNSATLLGCTDGDEE
ncbi:hypothetical protein PC128_g24470 [Phytophthora cactorum]|nr:hypothetical protein PC120_g26573 [Phytophthora cactorum]KAG3144064.1 hypothetical protein PC128_g24470 [Phytophthora cactorum]KAG4039185.1 hypothetical protein PC123_g25261 [Phytophthora cactorum]